MESWKRKKLLPLKHLVGKTIQIKQFFLLRSIYISAPPKENIGSVPGHTFLQTKLTKVNKNKLSFTFFFFVSFYLNKALVFAWRD